MIILVFALAATAISIAAAGVEFIEEPRSQSILIGESAIFNCKAYAHLTTWYINGHELEHPYDWGQPPPDIYLPEPLFSRQLDTYNLSMTVSGTLLRNNTRIHCVAIATNFLSVTSDTAVLQVYQIQPPNITLDVSEWPSVMTLLIQTSSFWFDFGSSHYNLTLTLQTDCKRSDGVLYSVSIPTMTSSISISKDVFQFENCSQYLVSATSVSPTLGRSTSIEFIFTSPQVVLPSIEFSNRHSVYFDKSLNPLLSLHAQVSSLCHLLKYAYFVMITATNQSLEFGPKQVAMDGLIREEISNNLHIDTQYTVWIEIESFHPTALALSRISSSQNIFNTEFNLQRSLSTNSSLSNNAGGTLQIVSVLLGVLSGLLLLTLLICVTCCLVCRNKRRGINRKSTSTSQAMIENPIYNGPVYETVPQRYNPLCSSASTTPDSSPTTPLNDNIHCTANPTYRTGIIDLVRKNTLPTQPNDRILSPLAGTSYRSSNLSGNSTEKRPHHERNKLHLTLSDADQNGTDKSGTKKRGSGSGPLSEEDANYTVMSPAVSRTFGNSLNGGWGETNPEVTSKYKE
ncbi:uncharacterized protein LOC135352482 isoform X1 [Halichondria panicea]|uniref:uncharacterized protein LOC135352482 isoform X1 n=1 Tax=Halichondria panicea TaxID=6063 RepID=UPI00312B2B0C